MFQMKATINPYNKRKRTKLGTEENIIIQEIITVKLHIPKTLLNLFKL